MHAGRRTAHINDDEALTESSKVSAVRPVMQALAGLDDDEALTKSSKVAAVRLVIQANAVHSLRRTLWRALSNLPCLLLVLWA
jgi:hypothetical protein